MNRTITLCRERNPQFLNVNAYTQKLKCDDFAKANNLEIIQEYICIPWNEDDTIQFTSDPLVNIKEAAEKGEVDTLLVYSFYCIGRQDIETPIAIQALLRMGVTVQSVMEGSFI